MYRLNMRRVFFPVVFSSSRSTASLLVGRAFSTFRIRAGTAVLLSWSGVLVEVTVVCIFSAWIDDVAFLGEGTAEPMAAGGDEEDADDAEDEEDAATSPISKVLFLAAT